MTVAQQWNSPAIVSVRGEVTRAQVNDSGHVFVAYSCDLPGDYDGGIAGEHRVVSIIEPYWLAAAHVVEVGPVFRNYIASKFGLAGHDPRTVENICKVVAASLGQEVSS